VTLMKDEDIQELMMRVVDGVAAPDEEMTLAEAIRGNERWKTELRAFRRIKEVTDSMRFKELPDSYWPGYWESVYRGMERGLGWILLSVGAIILLAFGMYTGLSQFYSDPGIGVLLKVGVSAAGLGVILLLVSIMRERLFARKHERYEKEVER
jgi:hypothetical protein